MTDREPFSEAQIKHLVDRFLGWKLPANFNPDAGISFKADYNEHTAHPMKHEPTGTNLLDAQQATEMVRYMLEGLPDDGPRITPPGEASEPLLARWKHRKRGTEYEVLTSVAEAQCSTGPISEGDHVTLYRGDDGNWWARKTDEFQDGRFERIDDGNRPNLAVASASRLLTSLRERPEVIEAMCWAFSPQYAVDDSRWRAATRLGMEKALSAALAEAEKWLKETTG